MIGQPVSNQSHSQLRSSDANKPTVPKLLEGFPLKFAPLDRPIGHCYLYDCLLSLIKLNFLYLRVFEMSVLHQPVPWTSFMVNFGELLKFKSPSIAPLQPRQLEETQ